MSADSPFQIVRVDKGEEMTPEEKDEKKRMILFRCIRPKMGIQWSSIKAFLTSFGKSNTLRRQKKPRRKRKQKKHRKNKNRKMKLRKRKKKKKWHYSLLRVKRMKQLLPKTAPHQTWTDS